MLSLFKSKLPVTDEQREWVDDSIRRLSGLLGAKRMLDAEVMLPIAEHFPDQYDGSADSLLRLFRRVAERMQVNPDTVDLQLFSDSAATARSLLPVGSWGSNAPGGVYRHAPEQRTIIEINETKLKDPLALVATIAHELAHVILLRPGLIDRDAEDMEPMTDLLTVFLGFGVFNANAAFQFRQYADFQTQGWSAQRLGYLPEEIYGYALARFAYERKEDSPEWVKYLSTNVSSYWKRSLRWLKESGASSILVH